MTAAQVVFFLSSPVLYNQYLRAETSAKKDRNIKLNEEAKMKNKLIVLMGLAVGLFLINCAGENVNIEAPENGLVIATGDKSSGAISVIDIQTKTAFNNLLSVHHNSQIRAVDNKPYLLERFGANNLKFLDKKNNYSLVYEQSLGSKVNPQDIAQINSEYAMIANRESNKLMVIKLSDASIDASKEIGIPATCNNHPINGEGSAEAKDFIKYKNFIYATVQNLGNARSKFAAVNDSCLLKIDVSDVNAMSIVKTIKLKMKNPIGQLRQVTFQSVDSLVFATVGCYSDRFPTECSTALDGGFSLFNLNTDSEEPPLLLETAINGNVHDIELISDTKAFFMYYEGTGFSKMHVKVFNPTTKRITNTLLSNGSYSQLLVNNGKLYVADQNPKKPGIRIFDVNTLAQETTDPINVGLPPKSMVVLEK